MSELRTTFSWMIDLMSPGSAVGLSAEEAETLQVVSYSIGGHYEPHVDYFNTFNSEQPLTVLADQDRMATFLFYLSPVLAGGATVFPLLGLAVPARPGSGLYWDNLDLRGSGHQLTLHAGCPVLAGHKVGLTRPPQHNQIVVISQHFQDIANLWFHYSGQLKTCPSSALDSMRK